MSEKIDFKTGPGDMEGWECSVCDRELREDEVARVIFEDPVDNPPTGIDDLLLITGNPYCVYCSDCAPTATAPDPLTPDPLRSADELLPVDEREVDYFAETGMYPPRICDIVYKAMLNTIEDLSAMVGICVVGLYDAAYTRAEVPYEGRAVKIGAGPEKDEWWQQTMRRTRKARAEANLVPKPERFPAEIRQLGQRLDRVTLHVADLIERTHYLVFTPERLERVRRHQEELARQRAERNTRRATERIERMRAAAERERQLAATRREISPPEHEEHPMCFKCNKRRAVDHGLCEPCARWAATAEAAKRV